MAESSRKSQKPPSGTKITFHQVQVRQGQQLMIPHVTGATVQMFEGDLLSAGSGEAEWAVLYAVIEPLTEQEAREADKRGENERDDLEAFAVRVGEIGIDQAAAEAELSIPQARLRYEQALQARTP